MGRVSAPSTLAVLSTLEGMEGLEGVERRTTELTGEQSGRYPFSPPAMMPRT